MAEKTKTTKKTPANTTKTATTVEGFGGDKQWDVIEQYALGEPDVTKTPGNEAIDFADADKPSALVGQKLASLEESINRMAEANSSMLKGEIPADVSAAVRRAASESSIAGGTFGSSARALSARDLGRTSFDIKQAGIANEATVAQARGTLAAAYEGIRTTNLTRNMNLAELSIKARTANLSAIDVERQRIATNIEANINIMKMISDMVIAQQSTAAQAAIGGVETDNIISSFDAMIAQFNKKLS